MNLFNLPLIFLYKFLLNSEKKLIFFDNLIQYNKE